MKNKHFLDHLGGGLVHGRDLQSTDQAATEARFKSRENRGAFLTGGVYVPLGQAESGAMAIQDKKKIRGGASIEPGESVR